MELLKEGYSIIGVKCNNKISFIVVTKTPNKLIKLAKKYEQHSVFFSDIDRTTYEINCLQPKTKIILGKLEKSAIIKEGRKVNITFIEDGQEHIFTTEK